MSSPFVKQWAVQTVLKATEEIKPMKQEPSRVRGEVLKIILLYENT